MSKSKGAILTVTTLKEKGYDPLSFRFMCLNSHYRKQLVFSYEALDQAENTLKKLRKKVNSIKNEGDIDKDKFNLYKEKFIAEISNDLNMANALTILYDLLKDDSVNGSTKIALIKSYDEVFSLDLLKEENAVDVDFVNYINNKIEERKESKKNKDYELADQIRNELLEKGVKLIDSKEGTTYEIIKN